MTPYGRLKFLYSFCSIDLTKSRYTWSLTAVDWDKRGPVPCSDKICPVLVSHKPVRPHLNLHCHKRNHHHHDHHSHHHLCQYPKQVTPTTNDLLLLQLMRIASRSSPSVIFFIALKVLILQMHSNLLLLAASITKYFLPMPHKLKDDRDNTAMN